MIKTILVFLYFKCLNMYHTTFTDMHTYITKHLPLVEMLSKWIETGLALTFLQDANLYNN